MSTFTQEQIEDAKWYVNKSITISQRARAVERKRSLTEQEVLNRVSNEDRERFLRGKTYHVAGAYRPE